MVFLLFPVSTLWALGNPESSALAYLEKLRNGAFSDAWAMEDTTMRSLLSPEALREMWEGMVRDLGNLESFEVERVEAKGDVASVSVLVRFAKMFLRAEVAVREDGTISGLFFKPYTATAYVPPPYASQEAREQDVTFGRSPFVLPGTLTLPSGSGPFPCVLCIHGSGANDRDETVGACKPFRDIALGLAGKGIAVFRYDKRTYVYPQEIAKTLSSFTVMEEVLEDALEALAFLRTLECIDPERIFLLGHSLGGWLAPEIALRDGKVRGVILCAAPARMLYELVPEQAEYLFRRDGLLDENEARQLEAIRKTTARLAARSFRDDEPVPYLGGYARYHYSLMDLAPLESARKLPCPILVIQGGRDYQVREKDFLLWKEVLRDHPQATFAWYPRCNHLLVPGEGPSTPEEYMKPGHVDEEVIERIASWIQQF